MVLGWRDVVQGPFEVKRQEGPVLVVEGLVDDLTYRVRSTMGPAVFRQMPRRSFIIARPPRPRVSPLSERLAEFAKRR